jgi:hypothetical protein
MNLTLKRLGWVRRMKVIMITVVDVGSDDKNYQTYTSATQEKLHSSSADRHIKIKYL